MASKYEVRQLVYTINRNWLHTIFSTGSKRVATENHQFEFIDNTIPCYCSD